MKFEQWMETNGHTALSAIDYINGCLGTNYPPHRVKEWLGWPPYQNDRRPLPEKVARLLGVVG
jgi:hypothetical protein